MKNKKWNYLLLTTAVILLGTGITIKAAGLTTEKHLAGISPSLDKYTEELVKAEKNQEETTTQQEVSTQKAAAQETAAAEETAEPADDKEEAQEKEETSHLKLNLVYDRLGVATVDSYLNVRSKPSENGKVLGKMTKYSGCHIYRIEKGWARIISGKVKGWVKAGYLVKDKEAEALAKKVATLRVTVTTETLNVRYLPSTQARVYDQISKEDEYDVFKRNLSREWVKSYMERHCKKSEIKEMDTDDFWDNLDQWMCIRIDNEKAFVSKDFVKVTYNLDRAVSIHQSRSSSTKKGSAGDDSSSDIRSSIVNYAMQFLGNRYVYGGTSLTNGTDCSGFTMRIYEHFGYSIPRTSSAQAAALPSVSSSEVKPGDLFFYGSGGVSHVAMYIGNNQIIHASNERTGIKISYAYYRSPIKIGRVLR